VPADPARRAAYDTLAAVRGRQAYANLLLPRLLTKRGLGGRDAAFATELAYGTLRAAGLLDAVIDRCIDRPPDRLQPALRDLLRLGGYQLLRTRVPTHAAVATTVDLARTVAGDGPARLVNAVLRRVAGRDEAGWLAELAPPYDVDPVGHLALTHSHPRWVVEAFRDALGGDLAETAAALRADDERPAVHLAARPGGPPGGPPRPDRPGRARRGRRWAPRPLVAVRGDPRPRRRPGRTGGRA